MNCCLRPKAYLGSHARKSYQLGPLKKKKKKETGVTGITAIFFNNGIYWMFCIAHVYKAEVKIM
jgi:hypothetical protein